MDKLNEEFIYQKKDFVKLGVKEGSFYKMIKDLEIDTPEYCTTKILKMVFKQNVLIKKLLILYLNISMKKV